MRDRGPVAPARHRARADQERGLTRVTFVGSFPAADFRLAAPRSEIALVGRSNVGKSSLLNALLGRRALARTSASPGKTRACNVYDVEDRYYVVDLPGYGYARASRDERAGFRRLLQGYLTGRAALAGVIWLLDVRHDPSPDDRAIGDLLAGREVPVLVALTKADKLPFGRRARRRAEIAEAVGIPEAQCIVTSVKARLGIADLRESLEALVA